MRRHQRPDPQHLALPGHTADHRGHPDVTPGGPGCGTSSMPSTRPSRPLLRTIRPAPGTRQGARPPSEALWQPSNARSHNPASAARRLCQARLRQAGEQYVAEAGRSTPTVHDAPHSGHLDVTPAFTASVLAPARRIRRQCRDRHTDEQNTAEAFAAGINGPPHPRHSLGPVSSSVTTTSLSGGTRSLPMRPPYEARVAAGSPFGHRATSDAWAPKGQGSAGVAFIGSRPEGDLSRPGR
jgi:hypothetical protein